MKPTTVLLGAALTLVSFSSPALATTMFGSLSNFDVINDTGQVTRGFEIELEGVSPPDISFTFGNPYIRYGDPVKLATATGTGTIVRYASTFGGSGWKVGTPVPAGPFTTGGHQCYIQGDPNYDTLGCEHFGLALNGNPTNTIYRWLLGDASGILNAAGTNVKIPAPVWNVAPPVNPVAPAAVQAVVPAPPKENPGDLFGEAMWVKVFVTESQAPAELEHLVVGDPAVPDGSDPAEVEIEWQLLQAGKGGGLDEVDSGLKDLAANNESVTRRYEFYKYIGPYDVDGEALVEDPVANPDALGEFLGAQNAALNLAPFVIPEPGTLSLLGIGLAGMAGYCRRRTKVAAA